MAERKRKQRAGLVVGGVIVGGGALALLIALLSGEAKADEPEPAPEPEPEPEPPPPPAIDSEKWGITPPMLRDLFDQAEALSGIPGLGPFLAITAWGAFRAFKDPVSITEAQSISAKNPEWCTKCHNKSQAEVIQSRRAFENVTLTKGQNGKYGVGKYDPPWPAGPYGELWADFGSAGLMDILAGSHAHSGIHEGFSPLIEVKPDALFLPDVSVFIATWIVHRILQSPLYKVLLAAPRETWTAVRRVYASPQGFLSNTPENIQVGERFQMRAKEMGIALDELEFPKLADLKNWPGAAAVWKGLGLW